MELLFLINIFEIFSSPFWEEEVFWYGYVIDLETHFKLCMEWFSYNGFGCL